MKTRVILGRAASVAAMATLAFCCALPDVHAGTLGKLSGVVRDAKKAPMTGVNVVIPSARLGALTDATGRYAILNVPAGTYTVRVSLIGYTPTTVQSVAIPADRTTALDVTLQETALQLTEVVVTAKRPVVELGLTSNIATVTRDQIAKLPVQDLQDIVNLQAGVVDGHIRGGRKDEVQYQVDGISVNNPFDNSSSVRLDRSVLEEVQVISGTFDAEYGQAMSGVVNAVLKRGSDRYEWSGEVFGGGYAYSGSTRPLAPDFRPDARQNYQLTLSGPAGPPQTVFLLSARRGVENGYLRGQRRTLVVDRSNPDTIRIHGVSPVTGSVGFSRDWLAVAKISNHAIPNIELSYQAILNGVDARDEIWDYRFTTGALPVKRTFSAVHGLEWTHTLARNTFYRLNLRENYFDYHDMKYDDMFDPRYDEEGPIRVLADYGFADYQNGAIVSGVQENRFAQNTNMLVMSALASRYLTPNHQIKGGIEWMPAHVRFGHPGWLVWSGSEYIRHLDEPEEGFPAPQTFRPVSGSSYLQDDLEWNDLRFRAGVRFEYFNPKGYVPGDLQNPANSIEGADYVAPRAASRKLTFSPRLGVSYPVTTKSSVFFAYGHFYQMPQLGQIFANADYSVLRTLQASSTRDYGVLGNPDVKPERTVQYQFGYKQELREWLGMDLTLFYKDIRDLLGTQIVTTYNNADYKRLSNADFGSVIGLTLALDQRAVGLMSSTIDYTWQVAKGNSSDPFETAARADAHEDARPRQIPLDWDQRHTMNLTVTLSNPSEFNASAVLRAVSGQPFTPASEAGFGGTLESNSGRKPGGMLLDLRGEKRIGRGYADWNLFARVFNVFDSRFFNGFVFQNTGSPYYSRTNTAGDRHDLANPTRYYGPRRIEFGVQWQGGGA